MSDEVRKYFDRTSREFDSIHDRSPLSVGGLVDRVFRAGMREREAYVLAALQPRARSSTWAAAAASTAWSWRGAG